MTIGTNASPGSSAGANASNGLLNVPYNRYTQLSAYVDAGTGYAGNTYTVDGAGKATNWGPGPSQLVAYPAPGETGVPRGTSSAENPNPLPEYSSPANRHSDQLAWCVWRELNHQHHHTGRPFWSCHSWPTRGNEHRYGRKFG